MRISCKACHLLRAIGYGKLSFCEMKKNTNKKDKAKENKRIEQYCYSKPTTPRPARQVTLTAQTRNGVGGASWAPPSILPGCPWLCYLLVPGFQNLVRQLRHIFKTVSAFRFHYSTVHKKWKQTVGLHFTNFDTGWLCSGKCASVFPEQTNKKRRDCIWKNHRAHH